MDTAGSERLKPIFNGGLGYLTNIHLFPVEVVLLWRPSRCLKLVKKFICKSIIMMVVMIIIMMTIIVMIIIVKVEALIN